jgi:glycosyltransferase involved in cell wall biosynthesis
MTPPTVLMIDGSDRGGIALYTATLVRGLRARGVAAALCAPAPNAVGCPPLPAVPWGDDFAEWSLARKRVAQIRGWVRRLVAVRRLVRSERPAIVHLQTAVAGPLEPILLRWLRRHAVVVRTIHNAVAHESTRGERRESALWALTDQLIVHSAEAAAVACTASGRPAAVIAPDLPDDPTPTRAAARRALGVGDGPVALLLGLLRPYKGVGLLADAWPAVRAQVPAARLVVAGSVLDRFDDLDRLAALDGVDARIGWLSDDDVQRWAAAADLCLLPYAHGAHSAVLHRSVVAGTPVLASPSLAEETERLRAGRVVALDARAWTDAIVDALTHPLPAPVPPPQGEQAAATIALYATLAATALPPGD